MSQGVFDMVLCSTEADNPDSLSVNDSQRIQIVDRTFVRRHLARTFLKASMMPHVTTGLCSVPDLQHDDPSRRKGLRGKSAVPRTVDPELSLGRSVCLDHQRVSHVLSVIGRKIQVAFHLVPITRLPLDRFHLSKLELGKLWIEIHEHRLSPMLRIARVQFRRLVQSLIQSEFW